MTRKSKILCILCIFGLSFVCGYAQNIAVKTNAFYYGTLTPNVGIEFSLSKRFTMDWQAAYKPWTLKNSKNIKFWLVQPELRYWFCEAFEGHFVGVHLHGAQYYMTTDSKIYDGYLAGGGLTYGYNWILSPHWNLEALIGVGYARLWYKESSNLSCEKCHENKTRNYIGPTKLSLSISYMF